ncbi:MAG: PAS domain-containing protein, partial [Acidimicrobiales bacterium]
MTPPPGVERHVTNRRRTVVLLGAVVVIALLGGSWTITSHLRNQAKTASTHVVAVTAATATLSNLENQERLFFDGEPAAMHTGFSKLLGNVLTAAHRIDDPRAAPLLATFVAEADRVVRLINANDPAQAAYVEQASQAPAGDNLISEYNRFAAVQSKSAQSTLNRASSLSQDVQLGALLLLALALGMFWYLDSRADRERSRAIEATEARYRGIVARGSDALWLVDAGGAVTFASESTRDVLGVDVDEARRPLLLDLFPDAEHDDLVAGLAAVRADPERPATVAVTVTEPDKRYLEVVFNNQLLDPSVASVVVTVRDLTDRKRAESALERSEALTQDLIDHTPALVYVKDLSGRYQRVNKAWAQAMGITVAEAVGATVDDLFAPDAARVLRTADDAVTVRGAHEAELSIDVDGRRRTFLASRFPLVDSSGETYAIGGVSIDITSRARAEDFERTLGAMMTHSGDAIFTT